MRQGLNPVAGSGLGGGLSPGGDTDPFPLAASTFATLAANAAILPSIIVPCQEESGSIVDSIGSVAFAPSGSPLYSQSISGLSVARNGVGSASGAHFECADNTVMDASGSVAHLCVFQSTGANSSELATKRVVGDGVRITSLSTGPVWNYIDGSLNANYVANQNGIHTTSSAECVWLVVDLTANEVRCYTSKGTSTASIAGYGTLTNTAFLRLLDGGGSGVTLGYYAGFEGAAAEAVDQDAFDAFWAGVTP